MCVSNLGPGPLPRAVSILEVSLASVLWNDVGKSAQRNLR